MPKILICYLVQNSGHHSAARAIETALHKLNPNIETLCVDLLAYTHPKWSALIQRTYMVTIRRTPDVWSALYDNPLLEYLTRKTRRLIQRGNSRPLLQLMDDFRPDVAVCTQAHPLAVLNSYADRHRPRLRLWGVVTDFVPHRFWVVGERPRYVVADESGADRLVWLGVKRERINVLGIPINPGFVTERHKSVSRDGERRVLVMGGSRGLGATYRTIRYLDRCPHPFTIDVVTGTNRALRARLIKRRNIFKHPIRIRGYVKDVVALMHRASVLISKPGGLTTAEATAVGLPLVIVRPLPGQERGNAEVLVQRGAAVQIERDRDIPPVMSMLLGNEELLTTMSLRARALGRPDAARDIAREILGRLGHPEPQQRGIAT